MAIKIKLGKSTKYRIKYMIYSLKYIFEIEFQKKRNIKKTK